MDFQKLFPILESVPVLKKHGVKDDVVAGLTVWVMLVPQGMAYALLAGMPPIYGLYGALIPLFLYALFGTSRQLSIGPVAVSSLLVLAGISQLAEPFSPAYISLVILSGLLIGLFQFGMSLLRLGFLVNFLSNPVISGFTSAAAVIIAFSQAKYFLGVDIPRTSSLMEQVQEICMRLGSIHLPTLGLGVAGIALMFLLKRVSPRIPAALVVVVLGILIVKYFDLEAVGIGIVGAVPEGLPVFSVPEWSMEQVRLVMPTVLTVTIMGVVEAISIAKSIESKHAEYRIRPNQELLAIGISKIGGAFFQALPTSSSFSRSAINDANGARTGFSSIFTFILIGLTLLFLTPVFYYLPTAILAAIILMAVRNLFDFNEAVRLWKTHRIDFGMMLMTFVFTLVLGIQWGVLIGVLLSIVFVLYQSSMPHVAVLGRLPDTTYYRNISRFPDAYQEDDLLIVRFDAQLYFGNCAFFKETILALAASPDSCHIILDASSIHSMDSSGEKALSELVNELEVKKLTFYLCSAIGPVRDLLNRSGLMDKIGLSHQFLTIHDAVKFIRSKNLDRNWSSDAVQANE